VIHPTAPSFVKQAHVPLGAATAREKHKDSLYLDRCRRQGMLFYPLVFETFGGFGRRLLSFIKLLVEEASGNGTTSLYGMPVRQFLIRSLSFCLQSGNSMILLEGIRRSRLRLLK
jgi:hypothetical protein